MRPLVFAALVLAACGAVEQQPPPCPTDRTPGDFKDVASGLQGTEGIAFSPQGRLFVSSGSRILEVKRDGSNAVHAQVPKSIGMTWWNDALYVAAGDDGSDSQVAFCNPGNKGAIWRVGLDGTASVFATGILWPNFVTPTPWGTLLVSDDCATNTTIWEVTKEGVVSRWHEGVPSANGLAFSLDGTSLFTVSTFTNPPPAWRIPVANKKSGAAEELIAFDGGTSPDGLAMDAEGRLYIALNTGNEIRRRNTDGTFEPFATDLNTPASMAFGKGEWDQCSMYVTSLFGDTLQEVFVGTRGAP